MIYDYLLTLDDECRLIWHRKMGPSGWIFLGNRVLVFVYAAAMFMAFSPTVGGLVLLPRELRLT